MLTEEEFDRIEDRLDEKFSLKFVKINDCNDIQLETKDKFSALEQRVSLVSYDMEVIKKLLWVIATATIGQLVAMIFTRLMGA